MGITLKNNIKLKLILTEPKIDFIEANLDSSIPDDRIIASIIEFQINNTDNEIVLLSADSGIRLKAKLRSFKTLNLDSTYKNSIGEDALEKENSKLQNKIPKLELIFENKQNNKTVEIKQRDLLSSNDIEIVISDIKRIIPKINPNEELKKTLVLSAIEAYVGSVTPKRIKKYNNDLNHYYSNIRNYLNIVNSLINRENRTIKI